MAKDATLGSRRRHRRTVAERTRGATLHAIRQAGTGTSCCNAAYANPSRNDWFRAVGGREFQRSAEMLAKRPMGACCRGSAPPIAPAAIRVRQISGAPSRTGVGPPRTRTGNGRASRRPRGRSPGSRSSATRREREAVTPVVGHVNRTVLGPNRRGDARSSRRRQIAIKSFVEAPQIGAEVLRVSG